MSNDVENKVNNLDDNSIDKVSGGHMGGHGRNRRVYKKFKMMDRKKFRNFVERKRLPAISGGHKKLNDNSLDKVSGGHMGDHGRHRRGYGKFKLMDRKKFRDFVERKRLPAISESQKKK